MMIFYLYRNKPWLGIIIYTLSYLPALNGHMEDPLALKLGDMPQGLKFSHCWLYRLFTFIQSPTSKFQNGFSTSIIRRTFSQFS